MVLFLAGCTQVQTGKSDEPKITFEKPTPVNQKTVHREPGSTGSQEAGKRSKAPPVIGNLKPLGRDYGCWLVRPETPLEGPAIFYVALSPNDIRMNINGNERQLTPITGPGKTTKYRINNFTVSVEWGPTQYHESACGTWETFPNAKITVSDGKSTTSVPAQGQCGCG
jgi:hypothetical protein